MADETPPMDDTRLAEIREYLDYPSVRFDEAMLMLNRLVPSLLAEVDRLRTREAALRSHLPRFLYPFESPFTCDPCPWCHCSQDYEPHVPDCPITLARALLAQE